MIKNKCIVFGANGYLGSHLSLYLEKKGCVVQNFDIQEESLLCNYSQVDITEKEAIKCIEMGVDYIFFFSGITGTWNGFYDYEKFISINEIGLLNLLDVIKDKQVKPQIIFPSTRLVYKGEDHALKEDDDKYPKTIYAINKLTCESILEIYKEAFAIPYTIFRICIPYGNLISDNYSYGTIGFFLDKAKKGENIELYDNGNFKRTFTHISDICTQISECAFSSLSINNIFNIGGVTYSLREAACFIASFYNVEIVNIPWPKDMLKIETGHTYFNDEKIKHVIGNVKYKDLIDVNWR